MTRYEAEQRVREWLAVCKERYELSPELPSGLKCKIQYSPRVTVGGMAGTFNKATGYYKVSIRQNKYFAHHIVAALADIDGWYEMRVNLEMNKYYKDLTVNHIDTDKTNNSPNNIEVISIRENCQRKYMHLQGKLVGASFKANNGKWQSSIMINGNPVFLGYYETELLAHKRYMIAAELYEMNMPINLIKTLVRTIK